MNAVAASADDTALMEAMAPLRAIAPDSRIAAPPQRLAMDDGRECLVQWRAEWEGGEWALVLHARSPDPLDLDTQPARLALHLPEGGEAPSVYWERADEVFRQWAIAHVPAIAREIADAQPGELATVRKRARLSAGAARKLGELLPHAVVLGGMAVFAYMFGVVHIN